MKKNNIKNLLEKWRCRITGLLVWGCFAFPAMAQVTGNKSSNQKWLYTGLATTNRFSPSGANFTFTQSAGRLGITGDAGIYFGKTGVTTLNKFQFLGGIDLLPSPGSNSSIQFSPHLLLGVTDINSKYKLRTESFSHNQIGPSAAIGANISFPINNKTSFVLKADYTPTLLSGCLQKDFRFGGGLKIALGKDKVKPPVHHDIDVHTVEKNSECKASTKTEVDTERFDVLDDITKKINEAAKNIPKIDVKVSIDPVLSVIKGEQCCSKDKPPAKYTELQGSIEGKVEVKFKALGLPDVKTDFKVWSYKVSIDLECNLYIVGRLKLKVTGGGRKFEGRPDCKTCWYLKLNTEGQLGFGATIGGKVEVDLPVIGKIKAEAKANAEVSAAISLDGQYNSDGCPNKGFTGKWNIGKTKANLVVKFKTKYFSLDYSYELPIWDGMSFPINL